jgi:hypothetical protein
VEQVYSHWATLPEASTDLSNATVEPFLFGERGRADARFR